MLSDGLLEFIKKPNVENYFESIKIREFYFHFGNLKGENLRVKLKSFYLIIFLQFSAN